MAKSSIKPARPQCRKKITLTVSVDYETRKKTVSLDPKSRAVIKGWNVSACVYVIVSNKTIQYVGCASTNFFKRFASGIGRADSDGYRWITSSGDFRLFVWKINGSKHVVEAAEAEVAFLHRAVLGDWPIEMNQLSPKRHLVSRDASAFGKRLGFGIYRWLSKKKHITSMKGDPLFLNALWNRSVIL